MEQRRTLRTRLLGLAAATLVGLGALGAAPGVADAKPRPRATSESTDTASGGTGTGTTTSSARGGIRW